MNHLVHGQRLPELWDEASAPSSSTSQLRVLYLCGGLFLVLVLLATFIPIGGAVLATGKVGIESRVKRISHPFGGVVAKIAVANGQRVARGQLLIQFDDQVSGADATYSRQTVEQLLAQQARLEAERLGSGAIGFPADLTNLKTPSAESAMAGELKLFQLRRSEEQQMRAQVQAKIAQVQHEISGINTQISVLQKQRAFVEPELKGLRELWTRGLVTIGRLNQLERTAVGIEGEIAALEARMAQARSQIIESQERLIQLRQTRRVEAGSELARVMAALNDQRSRSVAAGDQQNRTEVRAPAAGTVEKVVLTSVGDVVRPADTILEIVPDTEQMIVEVMVSPTDIDQVRAGMKARIRFSSFNVAATPEIGGSVVYVAADRLDISETREAYYVVRVAINPEELKREKLELRSGMPAEVHIETGRRSMMSYVLKPIRDQFFRAFRDN